MTGDSKGGAQAFYGGGIMERERRLIEDAASPYAYSKQPDAFRNTLVDLMTNVLPPHRRLHLSSRFSLGLPWTLSNFVKVLERFESISVTFQSRSWRRVLVFDMTTPIERHVFLEPKNPSSPAPMANNFREEKQRIALVTWMLLKVDNVDAACDSPRLSAKGASPNVPAPYRQAQALAYLVVRRAGISAHMV